MATTIQVDIVSAEAEIWSGEATMVFAPAEYGEIGILPRHAPLLSRLLPGEVRVQTEGGEEQFFYVSGGMIEVQPHVVTVLSDTAVRAHDLDEAAAAEAQERAERALADKTTDVEYAKARAELAQAAAQLQAIQRLRRRGRGS
jgi:F-type H+-transporting ATPase subunit epsilon